MMCAVDVTAYLYVCHGTMYICTYVVIVTILCSYRRMVYDTL
jgi:hypothetical protein